MIIVKQEGLINDQAFQQPGKWVKFPTSNLDANTNVQVTVGQLGIHNSQLGISI